jgi:two-component system sensor histidine kinase UhpB
MRGHQVLPAATSTQTSDLLGRLIAAQETERSRIARHLHDDVSQRIADLSIRISCVTHTLRGKPDGADVTSALRSMQESLIGLAEEVRQLSHDLHPGLLQHADLDTALGTFCAQFQKRQAIEVSYRADTTIAPIGAEMTLCLYRIAQEGLRNVAKHANADRVGVTLTQTVDGVQLSIIDDGKGFDLAGARHAGRGLGLMSIDERARALRGSVRFETRPQQGTRIHVEIPWPAEIAWSRQRRQVTEGGDAFRC